MCQITVLKAKWTLVQQLSLITCEEVNGSDGLTSTDNDNGNTLADTQQQHNAGLSWSPLIFWSSFICVYSGLWLPWICLQSQQPNLKEHLCSLTVIFFFFKAKTNSSFVVLWLIHLILDIHIWGPDYPSGFLSLDGHTTWLGDSAPVEFYQNSLLETNNSALPKAHSYFCSDSRYTVMP